MLLPCSAASIASESGSWSPPAPPTAGEVGGPSRHDLCVDSRQDATAGLVVRSALSLANMVVGALARQGSLNDGRVSLGDAG